MSNQRPSIAVDSPPNLSLLAQFDDLCRYSDCLIPKEEEYEDISKLINKCEENRFKWLSVIRELNETKNKLIKSEKLNQTLANDIQRLKHGFAVELQKREEFRKKSICLTKQLNSIREFVLKDSTRECETKDKVLSYIQLDPIIEEHESDVSISDIEYDKSTEEYLLDTTFIRPNNRSEKQIECQTNQKDRQSNGSHSSLTGKNRSHSDPTLGKVETIQRKAIKSDSDAIQINAESVMESQPPVPHYYTSSPQLLSRMSSKTLGMNFFNEIPENVSKDPFEERKHRFVQKKTFKPIKCNVCEAPIGFFGTYFACEICRGSCHIQCKDKLPVPCIEYRKVNTKQFKTSLIADFAPPTRPMVPAVIIHCCNEIERRGLKEEGIYRKCGTDKEVRDLKNKIIKSKSGVPSLECYDIHVLTNVVKQFLRELDEPIVTRVLWRDFVRASDRENGCEESDLMIETMDQMPTSNSDSLAFLINHLLKVCDNSEHNLMDRKSLAKIFGPTIVGFSTTDLPTDQLLAEQPNQIRVMEALLKISADVWNRILYSAEISSSQLSRKSITSHRRSSIVRGSLTPQRPSVRGKRPNSSITLKPLF